jgi:hypothetical protein
MTLDHFQLLSPSSQLAWVMQYGTYVAHRREGNSTSSLFYLPLGSAGFFTEVGVTAAQESFVVLGSFVSSVPLEDYTHGVKLLE